MIEEKMMLMYRRAKVANLIKEISQLYGGDDATFLHGYIAEVLDTWKNDLPAAIQCFEDLKAQALSLRKSR